jgi:hypothetical protein
MAMGFSILIALRQYIERFSDAFGAVQVARAVNLTVQISLGRASAAQMLKGIKERSVRYFLMG